MSDVIENIEETVDGTVQVIDAVRTGTNFKIVGGALFVAGLAIGGTAAYLVAKKRLKAQYEQLVTEEIADAKEFYANLNKVDVDGVVLSPQDVMDRRHGVGAAAEALRNYQGEEPTLEGEPHDDLVDEAHIQKMEKANFPDVAEVEDQEPTSINVFADQTFDLEEESKFRTEDKPYIITHEEYFAAERDYDTISLTYYEADDTLTNEEDKPIVVDEVVGGNNLRFGSGSNDKNIVYIRNEKLEVDYEVIKSSGSYLEEVLGMLEEEPNELKHSDQRDRRRAFRHGEG